MAKSCGESNMIPKALVFGGYGFNCERESAYACTKVGFITEIRSIQELIQNTVELKAYNFLIFPGGFSFGDELGAARVLAHKLKIQKDLLNVLKNFVQNGNLILGICNGFQILLNLGLLIDFNIDEKKAALIENKNNAFIDRWVWQKNSSIICKFTQDLSTVNLPIRHGQGRFYATEDVLQELNIRQQIAFRYENENPNGSCESIAGICDSTGRILGMMAHPEAAVEAWQHPQYFRQKASIHGLKLFQNAFQVCQEI